VERGGSMPRIRIRSARRSSIVCVRERHASWSRASLIDMPER